MTVNTTAATTGQLPGTGVQTVFNYTFIIPFLEDGITPAVAVYYTDLALVVHLLSPSDYVITGVGNPAGGSVTYNPGPAIPAGSFLEIQRQVPYIQPDAFPNQSFLPAEVEAGLDNLEMQIQQLLAQLGLAYPTTDLVFRLDTFGGGVTAGMELEWDLDFPGVIASWTLQADQVGDLEVDIYAKPYGLDSPATGADSICAAALPTLTANVLVKSTALTGWNTVLNTGTTGKIHVNSAVTVTRFTLTLKVVRTG